MPEKTLTCCGKRFENGGALASHRRGREHRNAQERELARTAELGADRPRPKLEPLEPDETIEDRPTRAKPRKVGAQRAAGQDASADIQAEIARGSEEYKGLGEDDYAAAARLDARRQKDEDLDAVDVTPQRDRSAPPRQRREPGREGDEFAYDRKIEREGELPSENKIKEAPGPFPGRRDFGRETLERLRGDGISNESVGEGPAMRHSDDERDTLPGRRPRGEPSPDDVADEYDEQVGDPAKQLDAVFDWCLDYRGARHRFSRYYYRQGVLLDFFRGDTEHDRREAADKARRIAEHNAELPPRERVGYIAAVVGTPLRYEDLARAKAGEIIPRLQSYLPADGTMIGGERTVNADQFSRPREVVVPGRFRSAEESMREVRESRPADPGVAAVTIDGVQYYVPRAVADGFAAVAERVHEGERIAKAGL